MTDFIKSALAKLDVSFKPETKGEFQRLEYLGDGILQAIITEYLYFKYPKANEGELTIRRSRLVQNKTLSKLAIKLGYRKLMQVKNKKLYQSKKLYADVFEASIGEYFLTTKQNYAQVRKFIFAAFTYLNIELELIFDPISQLNEAGQQKLNNLPVYTLVKRSGPDHEPEFKMMVSVLVKGKKYKRTAVGKSKQDAKEKAAKKLYKFLKSKNYI